MSEAFVLDASAVVCLLKGETGSDHIVEALPDAVVSAVNISEVYAKLSDAGGSDDKIAEAINALHLKVEAFDDAQAKAAGSLRRSTRRLSLSLGDRACLALAQRLDATALTTDRAWAALPADLGLSIRLVR